jgi:probable phosphomutase (TIGR03848 family)
MTVLLLVRHGLADATGERLYGRTEGVHLSERGRAQAEDLARRLGALPIEAVYTSPLERCRETAGPIATVAGVRVRAAPGLLETDTGDWTGRSFKQIGRTRLWRRIRVLPSSARFPAGESLTEVQARALRALERIAEGHRKGLVAVVSHGDPIRLALAHYAGVPLDLFQRLEVEPASVSAVSLGSGPPRILRLNDTGGFGDMAPRGTHRG